MGGEYKLRLILGGVAAASGAALTLSTGPASGSVFENRSRWPMINGYATIKVCIDDGSSVEQKQPTDLVVHAPNRPCPPSSSMCVAP